MLTRMTEAGWDIVLEVFDAAQPAGRGDHGLRARYTVRRQWRMTDFATDCRTERAIYDTASSRPMRSTCNTLPLKRISRALQSNRILPAADCRLLALTRRIAR